MKDISVGDMVLCTAGRDKEKVFAVLSVNGKQAFIADGKTRRVESPKKKNLKHLIKLSSDYSKELSDKINGGQAIGNKSLYKKLDAVKQKS